MKIDLSNLKHHVQKQFKWIFKGKYNQRFIVMKSGRGSGKSTSLAQLMIVNSFTKKGNILIVQSTYSAMKEATFAEITGWIEQLGLSNCFTYNKQPLTITNDITGVKFIFRGCDKPEKLKSMKGIETVWLEEADLITREAFDTINLSARGGEFDIKIYLSFNPSSPYTWIKEIIDAPETHNCLVHHSYYYDNQYLDQNFYDEMLRIKETNPDKFLQVGMGEFGSKEGLCINKKIETYNSTTNYGNNPYVGIGIDFGFNHNQAFTNVSYYQDTNTLVINDVIAKSGLTNKEFMTKIPNKYKNQRSCYADSASPDKIKELSANGFKFVGANKLKLKVDAFIEFMNSLDHLVVKSSATQFNREAGIWSYLKDSDVPKKEDDDIMDAIRYALQPILLARLGKNTNAGYKRI